MTDLFSNFNYPVNRFNKEQTVHRAHNLKFAARRNEELPNYTNHRSRDQFSPSSDQWTSTESPKSPSDQELLSCIELLTETPKPTLSPFLVATSQDATDDLLKHLDLDINTLFQDVETPCPDTPLTSTDLTTLWENPNNPFASTNSINSSSSTRGNYRKWATERAKALLGPDAEAKDYERLKKTERAKALLGPDATTADYHAYKKAIRNGALPKNTTAEQFWQFRATQTKCPRNTKPPTQSQPPKPGSAPFSELNVASY